MNVTALIGKKVSHKSFGEGTIKEIESNYVSIDFGGRIRKFPAELMDRYFLLDNQHDQELLSYIAQAQAAKAAEEAAKRLQEEAAKQTVSEPSTKFIHPLGKGLPSAILNTGVLESMKPYGTKAQEIYDICCSVFGWKRDLRGNFALQKRLYAADATSEHYSVWFLANSNWTGTQTGNWRNEICDGIKHIKEHWDDISDPGFSKDDDIRVVFAKNQEKNYVFLGIYKCIDIDGSAKIKTYELMGDEYECLEGGRSERRERDKYIRNKILRAHIYLEWDRGFHSFDIIEKHPSHIRIIDRECDIEYTENRSVCSQEHKVINDRNYGELIAVFSKYKHILSKEVVLSISRFPFGGVGSYNYSFEDVSNLSGGAHLFQDDDTDLVQQAYAEYHTVLDKIIAQ